MKGIEELAKHQTLQYKWMRYLPREESLNHSPFWKDMVSEIKSPLSQAQVLVPIRQAARCPIQQMRQLEPRYLDKNGDPLIPDLCNSPMYLSKDYEDNDLNILREYGLSVLQVYEIYPILSAMVQEQSWKEAIFETRDEDWHSRLAKLILAAINYDMTQLSGSSQPSGNIGPPSSSSGLFSFGSRETADAQIRGNSNTGPSNISLFAFSSQGKTTASATGTLDSRASTPGLFSFSDQNADSTKSTVKTRFVHLPLIPLASGKVAPARPIFGKGTTCHFSDFEGIPVPRDLVPRVVLPAAAANASCRQLYESLGVLKPSPSYVIKMLVAKHTRIPSSNTTLLLKKQNNI